MTLKPVSDLYGRHRGSDIYVVGTGPSLRVFPMALLEDKVTIGLNRAWKSFTPHYAITIHPELNIPEFMDGETPRPSITWVTKHDKLGAAAPELIAHAEEHFHFFRTDGPATTITHGLSDAGRVPAWAEAATGDFLYLWGSIATSGVNLAANLGARNIILVGCDNAALFGSHHAHAQHTRWLGSDPDSRYADYYEALAEVRAALRRRGVNVVSLTPFLTLGPHEHDFTRLCDELGQPPAVAPLADISPRPPALSARVKGRITRALRRP